MQHGNRSSPTVDHVPECARPDYANGLHEMARLLLKMSSPPLLISIPNMRVKNNLFYITRSAAALYPYPISMLPWRRLSALRNKVDNVVTYRLRFCRPGELFFCSHPKVGYRDPLVKHFSSFFVSKICTTGMTLKEHTCMVQ